VPNLPLKALTRYSKVELCADIMFVDTIPFLVTILRHIKFGTVTKIGDRTGATILKTLQAALKIYGTGGFKVTVAHMDGEFEHLRVDLAIAGVYLNTASRGEHVGDIEQYIRTLKERTRAIYSTLPFQRMPDRLIIEMLYAAVYWLNSFPGGSGISDTMSPREIVLRQGIDYHMHCQVEFGTYVQTHEEHDNSMETRTTGAIAHGPPGTPRAGITFSVSPADGSLIGIIGQPSQCPKTSSYGYTAWAGGHPRALYSWTGFGNSSTTLTRKLRRPTTRTWTITSQEWQTTNRRA
jgi:hypothetical protein